MYLDSTSSDSMCLNIDCGSAILHALEEFIERAEDSLFDSLSYRLSYTADGSAPRTYVARKDADGKIFRGMVEARGIPWKA